MAGMEEHASSTKLRLTGDDNACPRRVGENDKRCLLFPPLADACLLLLALSVTDTNGCRLQSDEMRDCMARIGVAVVVVVVVAVDTRMNYTNHLPPRTPQ